MTNLLQRDKFTNAENKISSKMINDRLCITDGAIGLQDEAP